MSELSELNEALDRVMICDPYCEPIHDAARRYAAGTPLKWCETHRNEGWDDYQGDDDDNPVFTGMRCSAGAWIEGANAWDCSIVAKWITDPPEAVADARRTEEEG